MHVSIYYVDHLTAERDQRIAAFDAEPVPAELYRLLVTYQVEAGTPDADVLTDAFRCFNVGGRKGLRCRSFSCGDLVCIRADAGARLYRCKPVGWVRVDDMLPQLEPAAS
jgi:hypothetical protein